MNMLAVACVAAAPSKTAAAAPTKTEELCGRMSAGLREWGAGLRVREWNSGFVGMAGLGMIEAATTFPSLRAAAEPWISDLLDGFLKPGQPAAKGIAGAPWSDGCCDRNGVPPTMYVAAKQWRSNPDDIKVIKAFANQTFHYPRLLPAGEPARSTAGGWKVPALPRDNATQIVWIDDSFMCTVMLSHSAATLGRPEFVDEVARRLLAVYNSKQRDAQNGLLRHGFDDATGTASCCQWGDGNGWLLMAMTDALVGYTETNHTSSLRFKPLLAAFQALCAAWLKVQQKESGMWRQLLNDDTTYLSSSATGGVLYSLAVGMQHGWLTSAIFSAGFDAGWAALAAKTQPNGFVTDLSPGFGINNDRAQYVARTNGSLLWGFGAVLRACAAKGEYEKTRARTEPQVQAQKDNSVFECTEVKPSELSSFCAPDFANETKTPIKVCTDATGFTYNRSEAGYKKQAKQCEGLIKKRKQCSNDPSACRVLTQPEYCGAKDQVCKRDADCLAYCYADCYPCNAKGDCDTLVAFGLVAAEGDTNCFSVYNSSSQAASVGMSRQQK